MKRRELLKTAAKTTLLGLAATQMPFAFGKGQNMVLPAVWGAPVTPAVLLGVAAKQGILHTTNPYQVKVWKTPDQLRAAVASGTMPVTMVPSYVAANFAARGKDVILANIMTFGLLQMVARDNKLNSLEDLIGKSIVMPFKNDMPDLVLQILCENVGIDFSALKIQYVSTPPEAMALFLKQRAELAFLPEPLTTAAIFKAKAGGQKVVRALDFQQQWGKIMKTKPRIPQAGMQIDRSFYQANPAIIDQLLDDIATAVPWVEANPQQAAEIGTNYLPLPKPILAAALPNSYLNGERSADIADEILFFFEQMYKLNPKIIGGKMPDKKLFTQTQIIHKKTKR